MLVDVEKPNIQLTYEQIAHLHTKDFERGICQNDFVRKYSGRHNIIQFMFLFRQKYNVGAYDPTPEDKLDEFISQNTPFDNWKEFLTAAYEHQAAPDEIAALRGSVAATRSTAA